ncbi:hypothetical protein RI844_16935 [Thalassotalea fonticola]|uniref:DUF997 family protein n=1 Tax=Thalassotalea fonticola TaxID=3065649 RepID=A0ABZ0GM99_9GAMM|nr:hypothetical protein RI844_16935 [Colwelliaceae bacterium S1-1]
MEDKKKYLFDHPKNIKRALYLLYSCCILLFILDFVIPRDVSHGWESLWGFYPIYGFISCVVLVRVATWMRTFLRREEDYYDNEGMDDGAISHNDDVKNSKDIGDHHVDD